MRKLLSLPLLVWLLFVLTSCFKEDTAVTPHQPGTAETDTIAMTQDYKYQVYFNLDSGASVKSVDKTSSDFGFECSDGGWHVILNTADFMKAADLGQVPFGEAHDTIGLKWKFDKSDGDLDSTAIGQWFTVVDDDTLSNGHVYAIDRGLDEAGNSLGLYQLVIDRLRNGTYYFRYGALDGSFTNADSVSKDPRVNFLFYSLTFQKVAANEPPKTDYDLLFTQYTTLLFTDLGEPYPYLVTGVLSNRYKVEVASDTIHDFESIDFQVASQLSYSKNLDAIGYDWKHYNFETGSYTVDYQKVFVVKTTNDLYYKMRFTGFYSSSGEKGYPVLEFQKL
jgi:hypothetical protein